MYVQVNFYLVEQKQSLQKDLFEDVLSTLKGEGPGGGRGGGGGI